MDKQANRDDQAELQKAAQTGTLLSYHASRYPNQTAIYSVRGDRTFAELDANANRLARILYRAGLKPGDGVALLCPNTPEFVETYAAALRGGFRLTPINWHLTSGEIAYIVADCQAKALIAHASLKSKLDQVDADLALTLYIESESNCASYALALSRESGTALENPTLGRLMLYTSGTTGKPKGVYRKDPIILGPQWEGTSSNYRHQGDVNLCSGPMYHGGPLRFDVAFPLASGVPAVLMEKFDAEAFLSLVTRHRITHAHLVATMFQRLLRLPTSVREAYDVSSLRVVFHGAAPTPVSVKRAMIEWWGPKLVEYYGATEGGGNFRITSEEWLKKPGSVGKVTKESGTRVLDAEGRDCPPGEVGMVHFWNNLTSPFEYFNAPEKTRSAFRGEHFTVGDMGYIDDDGYLFLTGRTAECIISGGVNIYPQEIDDVLVRHPAVRETCTVGVPNEEWGEEVKAVVALNTGYLPSDSLAREILEFVRRDLAGYKAPRSLDFSEDLPRSEAGKIQRRVVRERYWKASSRSI